MKIKNILDKFPNKKIAVVGDIILDKYIYGNASRISQEAPVPIVKVEKEIYEIGGAGNVAANIISLGGNAFLFGYVGKDSSKDILINLLKEKGIKHNLYECLNQTTEKTRIIGNGHQITRVDREDCINGTKSIEDYLAKEIGNINPDIIITSDYAKGCLTNNLFSLIKNYNPGVRIIVDPKPNQIDYSGAYLITPNLKEAREMSGLINIPEVGKAIQEKYNSNVLITLGKEGMSLIEGTKILNIPTQAKEVYDVIGAGDTVIAVMGLGLASGLNLEESAYLSNQAAGLVVSKAGTATISRKDLEQTIESGCMKIKSLKDLVEVRKDYCRKNKKVVWTNGCFDILHIGHVDYLKKAKMYGDCLFVGLNTDNSIRKLKGEGRPINKEEHRAEVLSSLGCVDYVTLFNEQTSENCLNSLRPDIYVKAGDYNLESMNQGERKVIESYGGKIKFIPIKYDVSTTKVIEKINENNNTL
jgi:D-beta-D-heptose 7-phosphate kinase/D-beta-D-heptose 1-phosphate adenosyltransferase